MLGSLILPTSAIAAPTPASSRTSEAAAIAPKVKITDLGPIGAEGRPGGGNGGYVSDINNSGEVTFGIGKVYGDVVHSQAKLFSNGSITDIHALLGLDSTVGMSDPYEINEDGTVLVHTNNEAVAKSYLVKKGKITPLGKWIIATNDRGQTTDGRYVYDPDGSQLSLPAFKDQYLEPSALSNSGSAVGWADMNPGAPTTLHAFRTRPGEPLDLTRDELEVPGASQTRANDVNDKGQVAGQVDGHPSGDSGDTPIIWDKEGKSRQQQTPYGGRVEAINEAGVGVGVMYTDESRYYERAALYRNGVGTDLNSLLPPDSGWTLTKANAINDVGQIAGVGRPAGAAEDHAFLLDLGDRPVIDSVSLETKRYPSEQWGTAAAVTDGDPARITVSVTNPGTLPVSAQLKLYQAPKPGESVDYTPLPKVDPVELSLAPKETVNVRVNWDSAGVAWERGEANLARYVKARLYVGDVRQDFAESGSILTRPKPVVLVHGWKSDAQLAWGSTHAILRGLHPYIGSFAVGDGQFGPDGGTLDLGSLLTPFARTKTLAENARELAKYTEEVRKRTGAWHVDLIAHSMGGLVSRQMIQDEMPKMAGSPDHKPVVNRMMQMGTPNRGTPCADLAILLAAATKAPIPYSPATEQVTMSFVHGEFNDNHMNLRGVIPSNLAGVGRPLICAPPLANPEEDPNQGDLIVPLWSARFYPDIPRTGTVHMSMTDSAWDFKNYIKPRLAAGPGIAGGPSLPGLTEEITDAAPEKAVPDGDAKAAAADDGDTVSMFATSSTAVEAGKTVIVPVDVPQGTAFGVTGTLPPTVGLLLRDPAGKPAAQYAAGSDEARQPVQGLGVTGPQAGVWKLEITNTAAGPVTADLGAWIAGNPVKVAATVEKPSQDGRLTVTGTVTDAGQPVTGVPVRAIVTGKDNARIELSLADDGNSGDGAANDGVYGATSEPLADSVYSVVVKADTAKGMRNALEVVEVKRPDTREFALTLSARPGGSVAASPSQATYRAGTKVKVSATPEAGRVPIGWVIDGKERGAGALTLTMDQAHTVEARFGTYKVTEIGTLPGGDVSGTEADALNDRGQVSATVTDKDGKLHAVRWQDGVVTDLGGPACTDGQVKCETGAGNINEAGDVAGWAVASAGGQNSPRAVIWRGDGSLTDVVAGDAGANSGAAAVNVNGQVLGWSGSHGVLWDRGTEVRMPADYAGAGLSYNREFNSYRPIRMNGSGTVAGGYALSRDDDGSARDTGPMMYEDGVLTRLPGTVQGCLETGGRASDLNNTGLVVGTMRCGRYEGTTTKRAYVWKDGGATDLGEGEANAVNDNDVIVGTEQSDVINVHKPPLMWVDGTKYPLMGVLSRPYCPRDIRQTTRPCVITGDVLDINSLGQILVRGAVRDRSADGTGFTQDNRQFLLSPTEARADLEVTTAVSATEPGPGTKVTWTATVTNKGDDTATDVRMDVLVPQTLTGAACDTWRGICTAIKGGFRNTAKVLKPGWSATVEVNATIPAATAEGTELKAQATATSFEVADPEPADNTAEITATVRHALSTTAINWPDPVRVGASSYEGKVTLTNRGNKDMPITVIQTEGPFEQTNNCPVKLAPNATCVVSARFVPTRVGEANGKLTFTTDGTGPAHTVTLTGHGSQANARPVLEEPTAPLRATVGQPLSLRIHFTDADRADTHTAQVEWSEPPVPAEVTQHEGGGIVTASKIFTEAREGVLAVLVTDSKGDTAERYIDYVIEEPTPNTAPTLSVGADIELSIGENLQRTISFTDPDSTTWNASADYGDGSGPAPVTVTNRQITLQHRWTNAGTYPVIVTVRDDGGLQTSATFTTTITTTPTPNQAPTVKLTGPDHITEGTTWQATASFTDPDSTTWNASADYGDGSGPVPLPLDGKKLDLKHTATDNGERTITVTVTDDKGATATTTLPLTITNAAPQVSLTDPPLDTIVSIDTPITLKASFTDPGTADTHTATWTVNGQQLPATLTEHNGHGTATRSHVFTKAGRYPISVTVTDDDTTATTTDTIGDQKASIIVYDPLNTIVGSGQAASPAGSCQLNTACGQTSAAVFALTAGYSPQGDVPTGELSYDVPGFSLRDTSYTVLAAANRTATLRGTGRVNDTVDVRFEITATDSGTPDGRSDRLRLKVWRENGELVYDNGRTNVITSVLGNIRISD